MAYLYEFPDPDGRFGKAYLEHDRRMDDAELRSLVDEALAESGSPLKWVFAAGEVKFTEGLASRGFRMPAVQARLGKKNP